LKRKLGKKLLTSDLITFYFNEFKKAVLDNLKDNDFILLFLKMKFHSDSFKTLGHF
jgi:hypothetical protein